MQEVSPLSNIRDLERPSTLAAFPGQSRDQSASACHEHGGMDSLLPVLLASLQLLVPFLLEFLKTMSPFLVSSWV